MSLRDLYWNGVAVQEERMDTGRLAAIEAHLRAGPIHDGHVPLRGDGTVGTWETMLDRPVVCPPLVGGTLCAPHVLAWVLQFTDRVERYLGGFPYLYSVHSFWTRPSDTPPNGDIQEWHVDRDADDFLVLFLYGNDILAFDEGPHALGESRIYGPAGTCFLADTRKRHMGHRPLHGQRLMHWARWCLGVTPRSYAWDAMAPVSWKQVPISLPDARLRESTKLLVDWGV